MASKSEPRAGVSTRVVLSPGQRPPRTPFVYTRTRHATISWPSLYTRSHLLTGASRVHLSTPPVGPEHARHVIRCNLTQETSHRALSRRASRDTITSNCNLAFLVVAGPAGAAAARGSAIVARRLSVFLLLIHRVTSYRVRWMTWRATSARPYPPALPPASCVVNHHGAGCRG